MFKAIHGIAPNYLSDRIDMHFDIHGYDTRKAGSMNAYLPTVHKEIYKNCFFLYLGGKLWNDLPDFVKDSTNVDAFKRITEFTKVYSMYPSIYTISSFQFEILHDSIWYFSMS